MVKGKFIICEIDSDRFRFSLKACNGQVVANSNVYPTAAQCAEKIDLVKKTVLDAPIEDQTAASYQSLPYPKFEVYLNEQGLFCFRFALSEDTILLLGDSYKAKASCLNGIDSILRNTPDAPIQQ